MGRFLGSHTGEELDRPDLNKCPDCDCFFADDYCPICGRLCPEEMRAGNRKKVKRQKERNSNAGRVIFIAWYHSWWFIILSFFLFSPIVALVLLLTSPHKKSYKIIACVITGVCIIVLPIVLSLFVYPLIFNSINEPLINESMQIEDYHNSATTITPEEYYRLPDAYLEKDVIVELKVISKLSTYDNSIDIYDYGTTTYFLCQDINNENITILVRDCLLEGYINPLPDDIIKVYGRAAGEIFIDTTNNQSFELPCINMACVEIIG